MSGAVGEIVDYLRKRDAERTGWDDGGAFGAAADEIEGLGSVRGALAVSRTQNLTDTPAAASVGQWRSIDTAPRDGTWILGINSAGNCAVIIWSNDALDMSRTRPGWIHPFSDGRRSPFWNGACGSIATHWMPLPKPPNASGDAQVAARGPAEDDGQRSREAAESTGIEGGPPPEQDTLVTPRRLLRTLREMFAELEEYRDELELAGFNPSPGKISHLADEVSRLNSQVCELEKKVAQRDTHLDAIRARLRIECDELGDNSWSDDLHLADVIDRYLCRPVRNQIQALNEEIAHLRDRERDVEHGVVAEIAGYLTQLGHDWFADGDTRNSQIAYDLVKLVERGDWRAQPQPQPQPQPAGPDVR